MIDSIPLSSDILRTLSEGLDRLNDSSPDDRALGDRVRLSLAKQGYIIEYGKLYPLSNSRDGYVKTHLLGGSGYVWLKYGEGWVSSDPEVSEGIQPIYFDEACTLPIFTYMVSKALTPPS